MHVLKTYLARLHEIRATERGTPELSYRSALENVLMPKIRWIFTPKACSLVGPRLLAGFRQRADMGFHTVCKPFKVVTALQYRH